MKRKSLFLILGLFVVTTFIGCGGSTQPVEEDSIFPSETKGMEESVNPEAEPEAETETEAELETEQVWVLSLEKELVQHYEWNDDEPVILARTSYSPVWLQEDDAKLYPELAEALKELVLLQTNSMEDGYENLIIFGKEELQMNPDSFTTQVSNLDVQVRRADSVAVSLLEDSYLDCALACGVYGKHGYNFDTVTGKELHLTDVIPDLSSIPALVEKELKSHMWSGDFYSDTAVEDYFKSTSVEDISWTLDYNGVTFYFAAGSMAEEGFGSLVANIPFAGNEELFVEKYMDVPDAYMVRLSLNSSFFTELDGDGRCEELHVTGSYDSEGRYYSDFGIYTDTDASYYYEEFYSYGLRPYYVKTADEHHYLYLFTDGIEGYHRKMTLVILNLEDGIITKTAECYMGPYYRQEQDSLRDLFYVPTDSEWLYLDDFGDGFWKDQFEEGIYYGQEPQAYEVGYNGIPNPVPIYPEYDDDIEIPLEFDEECMRNVEMKPENLVTTLWLGHMVKEMETGECEYYPLIDSQGQPSIDAVLEFREDFTGYFREGEDTLEFSWHCQDDVEAVIKTKDGQTMRLECYRQEGVPEERDMMWIRLQKGGRAIWLY